MFKIAKKMYKVIKIYIFILVEATVVIFGNLL